MTRKNPKKAAALLEKGLDLLYNQDAARAVEMLEEAFALDPDNGKCASALALCYSILNDRKHAIECYRRAIELLPDDTRNYYCLGRLYMEENKQVEGMAVFSSGIFRCKEKLKAAQDVETYLDLAKIYAFQSQHDDSILTLFRALATAPQNSEIYKMLAEEYFNLNLYRESITEALKAVKLNPDDSEALLYAGLSYQKLNVIDRALQYFSRSLAVNPNQKELKSLHDKLVELKSQNGPTIEEIIFNAPPGKRYRGTVKWFNDDNGIGYIRRGDDGAEIFAHYLSVSRDGYQSLHEGAEVEFSVANAPSGMVAVGVVDVSQKKTKIKRGRVKWFDEERGVGEITLENNDNVLFHYTAITRDGIKTIAAGTHVECELFDTENGPQAFNVRDAAGERVALIPDAAESRKFSGRVKWVDRQKNMGIIDEAAGQFQAIFKLSEMEGGAADRSLKTGASVSFDVVDVESLESENVKKAVNVEVIPDGGVVS